MKKVLKRLIIFVLIVFVFLNVVAAFHAYKFTHFYPNNNGPTKKIEQMTGWEKASVILFGVNYSKSSITGTPVDYFQTFTVTTEDKLMLQGWSIPSTTAKGTVIMFHGHGGSRSGILNEEKAFHQLGYNVSTIDFRAHGNSDGNICTIGYDEAADVKAAYDKVAATGEKNIILWGISLGAATITKAMHDYPYIKPKKVILEMPFASLSDAVKGRLRTMHLPEQPLASLLTFWGGAEQGFWAFSHNPYEYSRSLSCPVLLQWGANDARVSGTEITMIYNNLSSTDKTLVKYAHTGHESLCKNEPRKWKAAVAAFLMR